MEVADLLKRLESTGVRVRQRGNELAVTGQVSALTPDVREELAARKSEILAWLESRPEPGARSIEIADRDRPMPLSFEQEQVWIIEQLQPGNAAYHIPVALSFQGNVDVDALEQAIGALSERHEVLRTTLGEEAGIPHQRADVGKAPALEVVSVAGVRGEAELHDQLRAEVQRPFDLAAGPIFRAKLFQGRTQHVLLLVVHHLAADGWSVGVLRKELLALYDAAASGRAVELDPLPIQYADFAAWQRGEWERGALEPSLDYWREALAGLPEALDLPQIRPQRSSLEGSRVPVEISEAAYRRLSALCREEGASFFMGALAAFQLLLHRFTGQDDIPVGTPIALRGQRETEALIGNFTNPLVIRGDLSGSPSCREWIGRVRDKALGAFEHAELPFEKLVEALRPGREGGHNPLYQVLFVLLPPAETLEVSGLAVEPYAFDTHRAQLDLALLLQEPEAGQGAVHGELSYATDLFDRQTVERLARHFERLVEALVADPDVSVDAVDLLDAETSEQLLVAWNDTTLTLPAHASTLPWIESTASRQPDAVAVLSPAHGALCYGELNGRANALARLLQSQGVGAGDLVAICLERTPELLVALLATWKAGAAYVPMDPGFPAERLEQMLEDSAPRALLTTSAVHGRLDLETGSAWVCRLDEASLSSDPSNLGLSPSASDLAYVIYTSGSTGRPKGVEIPHGALLNFLASMASEPGFGAADRLLAVTTFSFDIAGLELLLPLCQGGRVVLASEQEVYDGARLAELIETEGVTVMQATPATWRLMLDAGWKGSSSLRVLCGGEPLPLELAEVLSRSCGALFNMYGPTETTIWSTVARIAPGDPLTIGRPIGNTLVYILGPGDQPVPIGATGELCIGGAGVARGYRDRPELTADRFVANPFVDGDVLYRTGDLARYRADGRIECLGRLDSQIKLRGFRIELGEIEAVLEQGDEVDQAVVTAWGEGAAKRLVAYAVPADGATLDPGALRERLRGALPEYMVPAAYVTLDALPLTPNAKVDRKRLPEPDLDTALGQRDESRPRSEVEEKIAAIWSELLGIEQVGVHTSFFDVGGHSLLGLRVVATINERIGTHIAPVLFFEHPTIAGLAALLSGDERDPEDRPIERARPEMEIEGAALADFEKVGRALVDSGGPRKRSRKPYRMRESWIARYLLAPLYAIRRGSVRRLVQFLVLKLEGGMIFTVTLRRLYRQHHDIEVGDFTTGGFNLGTIKPGTRIGRYTVVTGSSRIEQANHPINTFSSNALFYNKELGFSTGIQIPRNRVEIGNDVFIGHNATILYPCQKIGDGAVVAAHAVVSFDVPPFAVVAGYPAQIVRYRFSEEKIKEILELRWWDASLEDLESVREEFTRPIEESRIR